jgi:hypothetical protein
MDMKNLKFNFLVRIIKVIRIFFTKRQYRVKEFNAIYDTYFGKGKGWIYVSNPITAFGVVIKLFFLNPKHYSFDKI